MTLQDIPVATGQAGPEVCTMKCARGSTENDQKWCCSPLEHQTRMRSINQIFHRVLVLRSMLLPLVELLLLLLLLLMTALLLLLLLFPQMPCRSQSGDRAYSFSAAGMRNRVSTEAYFFAEIGRSSSHVLQIQRLVWKIHHAQTNVLDLTTGFYSGCTAK